MKLLFGVLDVPYIESDSKYPDTTGEVAEKLESEYGVMEFFVKNNHEQITGAIEKSIIGGLQNVVIGRPPADFNYLNQACSEIEKDFKHFLGAKEMDGKVGGVPTLASIEGVSHRFKHKSRKRASKSRVRNNPGRPSFVDTGLYRQSFKAWTNN